MGKISAAELSFRRSWQRDRPRPSEKAGLVCRAETNETREHRPDQRGIQTPSDRMLGEGAGGSSS